MQRRKLNDLNPKYEARNTKQARITQIQSPKQIHLIFEILEFGYCLGFRISILGFIQ